MVLRLSSNMVGNSNDFPHKLLLTNRQILVKPLGMLGLTATASATDAAINKKILG